MMKRATKTILAFAFTLFLLAGMTTAGAEEPAVVSDYQTVLPVLDLVASAALCSSDFPAVISDEQSTLNENFIVFFFTNGLQADPALNITEETLKDVSVQEKYLTSIFSAKLPQLSVITPPETIAEYIGFLPIMQETNDDGDIYLIGELYRGTMPILQMGDEDYQTLTWEDRAIFTLRADDTALGGYRVNGFSVGSELLMEVELQNYTNDILVEYTNSKLGFSVLYPSLFKESYVTENATGASAALPDGSASFTVKRIDNTEGVSLDVYAIEMGAASGEEARLNVNDPFQYATVAYETQDGISVFTVYIVTDEYVYLTQLTYPTNQSVTYSMYTTYLENSFGVDEVFAG